MPTGVYKRSDEFKSKCREIAKKMIRCKDCGRIMSKDSHICPSKEEIQSIAKKNFNGKSRGKSRITRINRLKSGEIIPYWKGKSRDPGLIQKMVKARIDNGISTETRNKMSESMKRYIRTKNPDHLFKKGVYVGEKHYNWKGGITSEKKKIWGSVEYQSWRKAVFERDNYTCKNNDCEFCNNKRGAKINAHHIMPNVKYPELRYDVHNGITYCEKYHIYHHKSHLIRGNPVDDEIISIEKVDCAEELWDIHTETGNYVANEIITHNCTPSKRSKAVGFYMPITLKEKIDVCVVVDTSGSVGKEEYAQFATELVGMASEFKDKMEMRFITHDVKVQDDYLIKNASKKKIIELNLHGGGGTSHKPVFKYIKDNYRPKLVIFFTDGWSDLESINMNEYKFNKLIILDKNGSNTDFDGCEVIKL